VRALAAQAAVAEAEAEVHAILARQQRTQLAQGLTEFGRRRASTTPRAGTRAARPPRGSSSHSPARTVRSRSRRRPRTSSSHASASRCSAKQSCARCEKKSGWPSTSRPFCQRPRAAPTVAAARHQDAEALEAARRWRLEVCGVLQPRKGALIIAHVRQLLGDGDAGFAVERLRAVAAIEEAPHRLLVEPPPIEARSPPSRWRRAARGRTTDRAPARRRTAGSALRGHREPRFRGHR
jgi:hypothetical protein